jgi:hypothetical protein
MGSGDWSTDLMHGSQIPGDLTSASPVRPGESRTSNPEDRGAARRRARKKDEDPEDEPENGEQTEHRLDHLA